MRSLALRIETLVKTAYTLYADDYKNSVMNQTFNRCLDTVWRPNWHRDVTSTPIKE